MNRSNHVVDRPVKALYQGHGYCPSIMHPTQSQCNPIAPFNPTDLVSGLPLGPYRVDINEHRGDVVVKESFVSRRGSGRFPASGYAGLQRRVSHGCPCGSGSGIKLPLDDDGLWWEHM